MRLLGAIGCVALWLVCGSMHHVSCQMYDVDLTSTPEERVLSFPHRQIFMDFENSTMFGFKAHPCKRVEFPKENSIEGDNHVAIEWLQTDDCRYLGIGFPWAQYVGKNLKGIENIAAIQFHIRLETGSASKLPMFFALVDYAGKQANSKINLLNVEGQRLDDTWRKVVIPLSTFKAASKGVNLANIKELRIEFQREGFVHLDAIQIVPFQHEVKRLSPRGSVCQDLPIQLDSNKLWWGLESNTVQWMQPSDGTSLALNYNRNGIDKAWNAFGVALNDWETLDMSGLYSASALTFELQGQWAPMTVAIWSAYGAPRRIQQQLTEDHCLQTSEGVWRCALPIKGFEQFELFKWKAAREVRVTLTDDIQTQLSKFEWKEYRGHPGKPMRWLERQMR